MPPHDTILVCFNRYCHFIVFVCALHSLSIIAYKRDITIMIMNFNCTNYCIHYYVFLEPQRISIAQIIASIIISGTTTNEPTRNEDARAGVV